MDPREFKRIVDKSNILYDIREDKHPAPKARGLDFVVIGNYQHEEKKLIIAIGITDTFPNYFPKFFLLNYIDFPLIPHVEDDGYICYTYEDALVLDINNPIGIIQGCFQLAIKTLIDGFDKKNEADFYNEYEAYWRRLKNIGIIATNIPIGKNVSVIKYTKGKDKKILFAANDDTKRLESFQRFTQTKNEHQHFLNGIYIPLEKGSKILIPDNDQILNLSDLKQLVFNNISSENEMRLQEIISKSKLEDLIVFSLPQPNGNDTFFAVEIKGIYFNTHPLKSVIAGAKIIPLLVNRVDPEYMLVRGGIGNTDFSKKKVLLIGGGSIGGIVCEELVKAAITKVDIIDMEQLTIDNCYRHICGIKYVNKKKSGAIKDKVSSFYPHSEITSIPYSIETVINDKKVDFNHYDAIVVCTGNATSNMYLMDFFRKEFSGKPILFSWLDPFGIGGHCLITNINLKGCYQCLYSNEELHNIASFADANQIKPFSKSISGCGSVYVPYGSLDANQTAILTVRKVVDVLSNKEQESAIYSWKGDSTIFLSEGYKLSERYFQTVEKLADLRAKFYQSNCKLCGHV